MAGTPKYILTERIAQGGMAEIHLGKIVGSDGFSRVCAFKRILPHYAQDKEFIQMFRQEASVAKQLQNKNIVQVYDFVSDDQSFMLVMEYVDGQDLRSLLAAAEEARRRIPVEVCAYIMIEVLSGLSYAHSALDVTGRSMNIIHRDVSPQNVLISYEGDIKITDFGIAKVQNSSGTTQAGVLKGKFRYMSPEQATGKEVDARSDLFAAGVILYEMVTMTRLFKGEDMAVLEQVRKCLITPPTQVRNTRIPSELESIILKLLSKEPSQRYQSARAALRDLSRFLYGFRPDFYSGEVAEFMQIVFRDKLASSREKLRSTLALPVDAIGRVTKGMDVGAPESAFSSVVDVSGSVDLAKAIGQNNGSALGASTMRHSHRKTPPSPTQAGMMATNEVQPGAGSAIPIAALPVLELETNRPRGAWKSRSEGTRTQGTSSGARLQQQGTQTGQRAISSGSSTGQSRLHRKKANHLRLLVMFTTLILVSLFAVAVKREEFFGGIGRVELRFNPDVPFQVKLFGKSGLISESVGSNFKATGLPLGTYKINVSRTGFKPIEQVFEITVFEQTRRQTLSVVQEPELGTIKLTTTPPGAKISSRDGFFVANKDGEISFLPLGQVIRLDVRHPKCAPSEIQVSVPKSSGQLLYKQSVALRDCK